MKMRQGFVSNSSSTSFLITNINEYDMEVDLVKFVEENIRYIDDYNYNYNGNFTYLEVLEVAKARNITWQPGETKEVEFGDNEGPWGKTPLGHVFDITIRDGGKSENFEWKFLKFNR